MERLTVNVAGATVRMNEESAVIMRLRLWSFSAAVLFIQAAAAFAEATAPVAAPGPAEDLADLKVRASKSEDGVHQLNLVASQMQQGIGLHDVLGSLLNVPPEAFSRGLRYEAAGQVRLAQARAERYANILSNDLDGDGSVTRQEIADSLAFGQSRRGSAAETLITYDADRNDILSPEEIRTAVSDLREVNGGRRDTMLIAQIIDLDSDGTLSVSELERVEAALRLPEALQ